MGWVGLSLEKMCCKQKINGLEQRLVHITRELQDLYDAGSYAQQKIGADKSKAMTDIYAQYQVNSADINSVFGGVNASGGSSAGNASGNAAGSSSAKTLEDMIKYTNSIETAKTEYLLNTMLKNSEYSAKEQALQDATNAAETALELEQEQVQVQLQEARAEYQTLEQAVSQDIKDGAPKFVA